jgi:hypothetical protein
VPKGGKNCGTSTRGLRVFRIASLRGSKFKVQSSSCSDVRSGHADIDLLKNPPFILREPQDERKSGANHWRFSVHAEPSRSIPGFFSRIDIRLSLTSLAAP